MDVFALVSTLWSVVATIVPFIVVLGVVVFVHEYGHYIVARWCGIHSQVFSIGFGKEIFGWTDKRGTRWRVAPLPLGGYVKFLGDGDAASARADAKQLETLDESDRARSFPGAALWKRALTVAAGPVFNFILSIVIYAGLATAIGVGSDEPVVGTLSPSAEDRLPFREGDRILEVEGASIAVFADVMRAFEAASDAQPGRAEYAVVIERDGARQTVTAGPLVAPEVGGVASGGPADQAGLVPGDILQSANGVDLASFRDLQRIVEASEGAAVDLAVRTPGEEARQVTLEPMVSAARSRDGGTEVRPLIGVTAMPMIQPRAETPGPLRAVGVGVERTFGVIDSSLTYIGAIIGGRADSSSLGGPIRIASLSGDAAGAGIVAFLGMIALISASIGMLNLFPVPVLDGGHLLFYALEAIRGKPLGEKLQEYATGLGLALVLLLMVFVTWNDITSF
ncbi:MAG: RIP metalloprotease RseP [Pseudomonadota bacterium]